MVMNEADEAKASASLARLRLFLSSHAPNGHESTPRAPLDSSTAGTGESNESIYETSGVPPALEATAETYREFVDDDEEEDAEQTTIPAAGAVASVAPLRQTSKEFARVKYLLQCSLPGYRVHENVRIYAMENPSLVAQYEQVTAGLLELDSWVSVNDLGKDLADVHSYGFTSLDATQTNMKFTTGNLQFRVPLDQSGDAKHPSSTRQLVLCKIAVGRSLVIDKEKDAQAQLPRGYHSYYLHQDASTSDPQLQRALIDRGYYHEYILTNTLQILPQYLVRFTFSALDHGVTVETCALCEHHSAVVTCRNCEAHICAQCDHDVHSANKLVRRHQRTPLRRKVRTLASEGIRRGRRRSSTPSLDVGVENGVNAEQTEVMVNEIVAKQMEENLLAEDMQNPSCQSHLGKKVEFYCPVCQVAVCVSCKMVGDHSLGEKGLHRLLSIADAYESCLRESLRPDPLITSRKSVIDNKLHLLNSQQQSVQANKAQVATAIQEQCARVLRELDDAIAIKMRVLSSEMLELERQCQQIEWVDESLEDHRTTLPPVEFLTAWNQHKVLRAQQREFPLIAHQSTGQVTANLHLAGDLQIIETEQNATLQPCPSNENDPIRDSISTCQSDGPEPARSLQHRRSSDKLRTQLLDMKPTLLMKPNVCVTTSRRVVSLKCQQLLDEIRHDLLVQTSGKTAARAPILPQSGLPQAANRVADSTTMLRAVSVHPRVHETPPNDRSALRHRWATLLRDEMGLFD